MDLFKKFKKESKPDKDESQQKQDLLNPGANLESTERLSRKSIALIVGFAGLVLLAIAYGIMQHGQKQTEEVEEIIEQKAQENMINATVNSIAAGFGSDRAVIENPPPKKEIVNVEKKEQVQSSKNEPPKQEKNLTDPKNVPPSFEQVSKTSQEEIQRKKRIQQMRDQAFESALKSKISANINKVENSTLNQDVSTNDGRSDRQSALAYERERLNQRLQQVRSNSGTQVLIGGGTPTSSTNTAQISQGATSQANVGVMANDPYASMASSGNWELGRSLEVPIDDPYLVRAGTVIPATLISGMNSQIPGQIIAQVSQNVYDSAVGDSLLIPQGTRLIGTYNSTNIGYGQERIMCAWQRLVYPDGKVLDLGSMPGTDQAGYSGFTDLVDNHWWELISSAFLMSGVTAGVAIATEDDNDSSNDNDDNSSINDELRQALATQFGNVIAQVIQRNLNLAPTLEIRPGYKFNVMVTKDLRFIKPFEAFDYR